MGNIQISNKKHINDYNTIDVPDNYNLIRIISYNVDLYNSIAMRDNIYDIINYMFSDTNGKSNDIICLQGIHDKNATYDLVKSIKKISNKRNINIYMAPLFNDIVIDTTELLSDSANILWSKSNSTSYDNELCTSNIIISKHPIISHTINNYQKGYGKLTVGNIHIGKKIISLYNISLSNNYSNTHIDNKNIRNSEIYDLEKVIKENAHLLNKHPNYVKYGKSNIHLIIGDLNIKELDFNSISDEYYNLVKTNHYIDIFRYQNQYDKGYTNKYNTRTSYIMCKLNDEYIKKESKYYKKLIKTKIPNDILKILYKEHGIFFIQTYINNEIDYRQFYPIECDLMIKDNY